VVFRRRERAAAASTEVPGYANLTEIGGGAYATVYRAVETETGRNVALKILKLETIQPHLIETFGQEIQALGKVSDHPNIVTLYRPLSTPDGRPALVLELCRESLAQQIRRTEPLDTRQTVRVGIKIAGALETAHRNGILHRDMKPQNILVTQFDEPALADFGVAALQASAQATAGVLGFTTVHAAPEILEGHKLSPATDVYGLASTMYHLLTGLAPFAAFENEAPAAVILRILRDPARPLRSNTIPLELSDLLQASLDKNPDRRPPTAARFAEALRDIEEACSWPQTSYVAWGPETGVAQPQRVAVSSAPGRASGPSTPASVRRPPEQAVPPLIAPASPAAVAGTAVPVPPVAPPVPAAIAGTAPPAPPVAPPVPGPAATTTVPAPPVAPPAPTAVPKPAAPASPVVPPAPPARLRSQRTARPEPAPVQSARPEAEQVKPISAVLPPPPPVPSPGPSLLRPDQATRNVVTPGTTSRGQPSRPLTRDSEGLAPLTPTPPGEEAKARPREKTSRPVFVDPDRGATSAVSSGPYAGSAETVYEATILPPSGRRMGERQPIEAPNRPAWLAAFSELSPVATAGLAVAALVVIIALLLIVGVL
jgi:serine/threonine protein kinase